jgi:hypothetical protein
VAGGATTGGHLGRPTSRGPGGVSLFSWMVRSGTGIPPDTAGAELMDEPLRCIICGEPLDEDPRERDPDLVKPPNVHEACRREILEESTLHRSSTTAPTRRAAAGSTTSPTTLEGTGLSGAS